MRETKETIVKRRDLKAKILAAFLAVLTFVTVILLCCVTVYFGGVSEEFAMLVGVVFGYAGGMAGLVVYYEVYDKRRYKF